MRMKLQRSETQTLPSDDGKFDMAENGPADLHKVSRVNPNRI